MSEEMQKYRFLRDALPVPVKKGGKGGKTGIVIITGARQTGKTTLAKLVFPGLKYINLDSPENREAVRAVPSAMWGRDVGNAVIDEAQKEAVVFDKVKFAYDERDISFCVLIGSSQILLLKTIRESLAGRAAIYELWPLLMSELPTDATKHPEVPLLDRILSAKKPGNILKRERSVLMGKEDSLRLDAEEYLLNWGGMPALLPLKEEERWKWLKDYEYTYLERDLADLARLDDLEPFRKFQRLSALRSACLLSYSELARDASVSVDTARRYLEYLRLSYQVILLQPYFRNITSSVVKTPKLYWLDIGLMRQLSGFKGEASGGIYETMVVGEIHKWIKTAQKDTEMYFYRTRSGLELDLMLKTRDGIIGIEIKARANTATSDLRALKEVARGLGKEWLGGMVIYQGNTIKKLTEPDIWAVPSRRLFI